MCRVCVHHISLLHFSASARTQADAIILFLLTQCLTTIVAYYFETLRRFWHFITPLLVLTEEIQNKSPYNPLILSLHLYMCLLICFYLGVLPSCSISPLSFFFFPIFSQSFPLSCLCGSFSPRAVIYVRPAAVHTPSIAKPSQGKPAKCGGADLNCDLEIGEAVCRCVSVL